MNEAKRCVMEATVEKEMPEPEQDECPWCFDGITSATCDECDGEGKVICDECDGDPLLECLECDGEGCEECEDGEVCCDYCDNGYVDCEWCEDGEIYVKCDECDGTGFAPYR